jgi:hypothetical protein
MQPQVEWPWTVLRELLTRWGPCHIDAITEEFFDRRGAEQRFLAAGDEYCSNWAVYLNTRPAPSLMARWRLIESTAYLDALTGAAASAGLLSAARADPAGRDVAVLAARHHWNRLMHAGLANEMLRQAATLPPRLLADILDADAARAVTLDGVQIASRDEAVGLALAVRTQWVIALAQNQRDKPPTPEEQKRSDAQRIRVVKLTCSGWLHMPEGDWGPASPNLYRRQGSEMPAAAEVAESRLKESPGTNLPAGILRISAKISIR